MPSSLAELLVADPAIESIEAFVLDINGTARGKWIPREKALELADKGLALPRSVFALDAWGRDVEGAGLAFGTGDPDGFCFPVAGRALPTPWRKGGGQVMLAMREPDGSPFFADPRGVLETVVARFAAQGLTPVVATELEFYLYETDGQGRPRPPASMPGDPHGLASAQVLSTDALGRHEALFDDILAAAKALNVPADTLLRENGPGQFEINLLHRADALAAAEDAVLLKRAVKGVAATHGLGASFMAKPYGACSGSGMHVHVSLLDRAGRPVFADQDGAPTPALFHGVAGLLDGMAEAMLVLAPHANSYRRFRPNSHAPTSVGWGLDDRSAAVRVVVGGPFATRIEHRVAGADANPFLAVAAVLAGVLEGLEEGRMPPEPQVRAAPGSGPSLPREWSSAIALFAGSERMARNLGVRFRDLFAACKRQDHDELLTRVTDVEYYTYLSNA